MDVVTEKKKLVYSLTLYKFLIGSVNEGTSKIIFALADIIFFIFFKKISG